MPRANFTLEQEQFRLMRDGLNSSGREIYFSLCSVYIEDSSIGNSWRIANDINSWANVVNAMNCNAGLASRAGPGGCKSMLLHNDYHSDSRCNPGRQIREHKAYMPKDLVLTCLRSPIVQGTTLICCLARRLVEPRLSRRRAAALNSASGRSWPHRS